MTTHLVTFSDESMSQSAQICARSATHHGVNATLWWRYEDFLRTPVYSANQLLFDKLRGLGYWAWKPYVIADALACALNGDTVIYSDAGVEFINNVNYIVDRMDQDVFLFGNNWEHAHWCKRDVIDEVWPRDFVSALLDQSFIESGMVDSRLRLPWSRFGKQCQASVIFFRVSDYSRKFVAEWLKWCLHRERYSTICTDEWRYLIDDSPSIKPNHPEFREHRHDQAILTTLAYREGIKLHYWPAMYNDGAFVYEKLSEYAGDDYPVLFHHHRRRNHEWEAVA